MSQLEKALHELAAKSNVDPTLKPASTESNYLPVHITTDRRIPGYLVWSTSPVTKSTRLYQVIPESIGFKYQRDQEIELYKTKNKLLHRLRREIYRP